MKNIESNTTQYRLADAQLQRFKRSAIFRSIMGQLSHLAWLRRKASRPPSKRSLRLLIKQELDRIL